MAEQMAKLEKAREQEREKARRRAARATRREITGDEDDEDASDEAEERDKAAAKLPPVDRKKTRSGAAWPPKRGNAAPAAKPALRPPAEGRPRKREAGARVRRWDVMARARGAIAPRGEPGRGGRAICRGPEGYFG